MKLPERKVIELAEGVEMAFRKIPPGEFVMGSRGYLEREEPMHRVEILQDFWMSETPVTQAQFAVFQKDHKNHFPDRPENPAEDMTWHEARAFCQSIQLKNANDLPEGFSTVDLPTEAQWEYACRAGTVTEYHSGDGEAALEEVAWFGEDWGEGSTHEVRGKGHNVFGLYDMHGNVWEWCRDGWDEEAYAKRVDGVVDPFEAPASNDDDEPRVLRGGSWDDSAWDCRSAFRFRYWAGPRFRGFGFRVGLFPGPVKSQ